MNPAPPDALIPVELPAPPQALLALQMLLREPDSHADVLAALIEDDMALAAAVLRAVQRAVYGLAGRVQSVQQATRYLGLREVAALTLELGLRARFPALPALEVLWERAALRSMWMGRLADALGGDAWTAHSAGLFAECGKAVLMRHAPGTYNGLLLAATDDLDLARREQAQFGCSHDELGARLCGSWGLATTTRQYVRHRISWQPSPPPGLEPALMQLLALERVATLSMAGPSAAADIAAADLQLALVMARPAAEVTGLRLTLQAALAD